MGGSAGIEIAWPSYSANSNELETRAGLNDGAQAAMFLPSSERGRRHAPTCSQLLGDERFAEHHVDAGCTMASGKLQRQKHSMNDQGLVRQGKSPCLHRRQSGTEYRRDRPNLCARILACCGADARDHAHLGNSDVLSALLTTRYVRGPPNGARLAARSWHFLKTKLSLAPIAQLRYGVHRTAMVRGAHHEQDD